MLSESGGVMARWPMLANTIITPFIIIFTGEGRAGKKHHGRTVPARSNHRTEPSARGRFPCSERSGAGRSVGIPALPRPASGCESGLFSITTPLPLSRLLSPFTARRSSMSIRLHRSSYSTMLDLAPDAPCRWKPAQPSETWYRDGPYLATPHNLARRAYHAGHTVVTYAARRHILCKQFSFWR